MPPLCRILRATPGELARLGYLSGLLLVAEVALRLFPFDRIMRWVHRDAWPRDARRTPDSSTDVETGARLIEIADRHGVLPPSCLRKAVVLAWLLQRWHVPNRIQIGVVRRDNQLCAHAWVEAHIPTPHCFFANDQYTPLMSSASPHLAGAIP